MQAFRRLAFAFALLTLAGFAGCTSKYTGMHAASTGDLLSAARHLREAVKSHPQDAEAHRKLGLTYLDMGDAALAEKHLDQAAKLEPGDRISRRHLAITRERLGWQVRAEETYNELIKSYPDDRLTSEIKIHLARMIKVRSGLTPEAGQARFEGFREKGLLDQGGLPRSILVLPFEGPGAYPDYLLLARTLGRMIAADLSRMDFLWVIGPDEAVTGMAQRGLEWNPDDVAGSVQSIGRAYGAGLVVTGKLQRGFDDAVRADVAMYDPEPFSRLLETKTESTAGKLLTLEREVVDKLIGSIGILPNERERSRFGGFGTTLVPALGHYLDGMGELTRNRYPEALGTLERAVEIDPEYPCPHRALAVLYRMQGRYERAQNSANKGRGRSNPKCVADDLLLVFRIRMDSLVASMLMSEVEQGRTALRNGTQTLFAEEGEILTQRMREGPAGSQTTPSAALPAGWAWGTEGVGLSGTADPSTLGGVQGYGISAPDPATAGQ